MKGFDSVDASVGYVDIYIDDEAESIDCCGSFADFQNKLLFNDPNTIISHSAGSLLTQYEEFLETY